VVKHDARHQPRVEKAIAGFRGTPDQALQPVNYGVADGLRSAQAIDGQRTRMEPCGSLPAVELRYSIPAHRKVQICRH